MKRASTILLAGVIAVALTSSPASAQTKTRRDAVGDAPRNVDIRSAKVQNNPRNYALTVRFQRVQARRTAVLATLIPGPRDNRDALDHFWEVSSVPISKGRYATRLVRLDLDEGTRRRVACPGLEARWKRGSRGFARVVVPQTCFGRDPGRQATVVDSFDKRHGLPLSAARGDAPRGDEMPTIISTRRGR